MLLHRQFPSYGTSSCLCLHNEQAGHLGGQLESAPRRVWRVGERNTTARCIAQAHALEIIQALDGLAPTPEMVQPALHTGLGQQMRRAVHGKFASSSCEYALGDAPILPCTA